jgi:hypothetical protein
MLRNYKTNKSKEQKANMPAVDFEPINLRLLEKETT